MAGFPVETEITFLCMPEENIYVIQQGCQRQCYTRMHDENCYFFIFHLIDSEKQELAPVTNWFHCMNHIFPSIDHQTRDVQTSRGVRHIMDSGQCWEDKACVFFPHYCR